MKGFHHWAGRVGSCLHSVLFASARQPILTRYGVSPVAGLPFNAAQQHRCLSWTNGLTLPRQWPSRTRSIVALSLRMLSSRPGRQFIASVGKVADPAPTPSIDSVPIQERALQFPKMLARDFKSYVNVYRIRKDLGTGSNFSAKTFVDEAAAIYRKFMSALNRLDKGDIKELVTEDFFTRIKKQLPEKEERKARKARKAAAKEQPEPTFVTGDVKFIQARIVTLSVKGDHKFAQVTCDATLIRPELQRVRVVLERGLHLEEGGRWRICDLQRLPTDL